MFDQLGPIFAEINFALIVKSAVLLLLFGYTLFTGVILIQIRALNRTVHISAKKASTIVMSFSFFYLILSASLFIAALVIL